MSDLLLQYRMRNILIGLSETIGEEEEIVESESGHDAESDWEAEATRSMLFAALPPNPAPEPTLVVDHRRTDRNAQDAMYLFCGMPVDRPWRPMCAALSYALPVALVFGFSVVQRDVTPYSAPRITWLSAPKLEAAVPQKKRPLVWSPTPSLGGGSQQGLIYESDRELEVLRAAEENVARGIGVDPSSDDVRSHLEEHEAAVQRYIEAVDRLAHRRSVFDESDLRRLADQAETTTTRLTQYYESLEKLVHELDSPSSATPRPRRDVAALEALEIGIAS